MTATAVGLLGATGAGAATLGVNATAYGLGNEGTTLVTIASATGAESAVELKFEGTRPVSLDGIEFRPLTGQIYGYDDATDTVYEIDTMTGAATVVLRQARLTTDNDLDLDFNPTIDAMRIVTGQNENVVFDPINDTLTPARPTFTKATPLIYVDGNAGTDPNVVFNAYTNSVAGTKTATTTQYVIDTNLDTLATLANNTGQLTTVGSLTLTVDGETKAFDVTEDGGFDILSFAEGDNAAYALLTDSLGAQAIYLVDLVGTPGSLTFVTAVTDAFGTLDGFTIVPSQVPVPAAGLLLLAGIGTLAGVRRRRRAV